MLIQYHNIAHLQSVWDIRQHENIGNIFSKIWNVPKEELLTSFDGISINLPPEKTKRGWFLGNDWMHTDQASNKKGLQSIQGFVNLYPVNEGDATLTILEKSHKYHEEFKKIDYNKDYEVWKEEYYKFYLNIDKSNEKEYLNMRINLVENYLESVMFNLKYYFQGCPSWQWHYKFRVSPLLTDIHYVLENNIIDMNNIKFEEGTPYTPFQQLMLIFPPQMDFLIPVALRPIMRDDKLLCTQFYPIDFRIDATVGQKTQYSEAILPEIDEELLIDTVKKYEKKLTAKEIERNTIRSKPFMV
jgi:5'-3' exonuclease